MTIKRINWLFLTIVLVNIAVALSLVFLGDKIAIGTFFSFLLSQGVVVVPALVFLYVFGRRERVDVGFHKVKISTLLMIELCTFLVMPLVIVCNAVTLFFTDNTMMSMQGSILSMPFPSMLFMIGILGPFCEEFVFRGVFYRIYKKDGEGKEGAYVKGRNSGIRAILLSAFLFGLMHMNFNQALYAFVMGIFLALLVEATGSLWASVFCHMFFNSIEVVLMYASKWFSHGGYGQAADRAMAEIGTQELLAALSVYLVIAAVTTPIAGCVIVWIAKNEGRQKIFTSLFSRREKTEAPQPQYLLTVPLIVAIVLCLGCMSLEFFL